jgi:hypothetical protein
VHHPVFQVFVLAGCGHCEEYLPRARAAVERLRGAVRLQVVDAARDYRAQKYAVRGTPTTLVLTRQGRVLRRVGAVDDLEIQRLLRAALA